jgi:hypothetical protein
MVVAAVLFVEWALVVDRNVVAEQRLLEWGLGWLVVEPTLEIFGQAISLAALWFASCHWVLLYSIIDLHTRWVGIARPWVGVLEVRRAVAVAERWQALAVVQWWFVVVDNPGCAIVNDGPYP